MAARCSAVRVPMALGRGSSRMAPNARFFPLHDLAHYALETVLSATHGFYGLVAAGWEIDDSTSKDTRGPLPDGAVAIE